MFTYAAALAVMFICQNGLTGVIQAPPRRPRPPRKAASRGPLKGDAPNPLGPITMTTPARPTRWLLLALASIARAGHDSEETYVIWVTPEVRAQGDAGEPPDFAPGTNARRRTLPKTPPTRHGRSSRLLSAMSFRSTRSLAATATSPSVASRKSSRG